MTTQERFAEEWSVPLPIVRLMVRLANRCGDCNTRFSNGDPHKYSVDGTDKNENSMHWAAEACLCTAHLRIIAAKHGFTGIEYTGLGPTLKRGDRWVEIPY